MRPQIRQDKRQQSFHEEEREMDDMAVAASFAHVPATFEPTQVNAQNDTNDRMQATDSDEDDDENSDGSDEEDNKVDQNAVDKEHDTQLKEQTMADADSNLDVDDDDDDESDVDLSEALARMQGDSDDEGGTFRKSSNKSGSSQAPKTEHEVDPYKTPITDLETTFNLTLTVDEQERLRLMNDDGKSNDIPRSAPPIQLGVAGRVKCHMISDRTVVVESASIGSVPLDEGTLLVMRIKADADETRSRLLALGKVFEVFGPVSRPLYTIRLPAPPVKQKVVGTTVGNVPAEMDNVNEDEIALSDSESEVIANADSPTATIPTNDQPAEVLEDCWAPNGKYTLLLQATKDLPIYYIEDTAKHIDTRAIIRSSGRGCDASNFYDEEVVNANEMEFSDDEQEREFKNRNKRGGKKTGTGAEQGHMEPRNVAGRERGPPGVPTYTGFHSGPPPQRGQPAPTPYHQPPSQFLAPNHYQQAHIPPVMPQHYHQPQHYQQQQQQQQMPYGYPAPMQMPYGAGGYVQQYGIPPPPPPPAYPSYGYAPAIAHTTTTNTAAPGPQPPNADEQADTVYYDYT